MNNKKKLTRKIIEAIHGKFWEEAVNIETKGLNAKLDEIGVSYRWHITLGRVMLSLHKINCVYNVSCNTIISIYRVDENTGLDYKYIDIEWKLTKENHQEATLDYQTDETLLSLLDLFS